MDQESQRETEYTEFIKVTRKHQAERERLKKLELKKNPPIEEYYIDISQLSTLVLDNLVEAPSLSSGSGSSMTSQRLREQQLVERYGGRDSYEKIRSMEMHLDERFKIKCRENKPHYWPVIPINPKPYLNPMRI